MRQLVLDFDRYSKPSLENFSVGSNHELMHQLKLFALRESSENFMYIWGEPASGKTHLMQALAQLPKTHFIDNESDRENFVYASYVDLYLLDDCDKLSDEKQILAFTLFNAVRDNGARMISTGSMPPAQLNVREDLRSRMGWGLIYKINRLSDEEKVDSLSQSAKKRGMVLSSDVLPYLVNHFTRDMRTLSLILDVLDDYSLETKRAVTLPLLRECLENYPELRG